MFQTTFGLTTAAASGTYPFTVGLVFRKGDVPDSISLDIPNVQVVKKRTWSDRSLKHAIVSGRVALTQNVTKSITVIIPGMTPSGNALTSASITAAAPVASVQCGSIGTVHLSSLLPTPFRTWANGPEMVECHYRGAVGADRTLAAWFHVRLFADGRMWIRAIVENGYLDNGAGGVSPHADKSYVPTITIGGVAVYTNGGAALAHYRNTRYSVEGWIGGDPKITVKHDVSYLDETRLVPHYRWRSPSSRKLDSLSQAYKPMGSGNLTPSMGNAGFQRQIGILPEWDALFCATGDPRALRSVLANSSSVNSYPIVWRDFKTNLIPKPSSFPNWSHNGPGGGGTNHRTAGSLTWERAHHPSEGYLAYLLTGDYWHYEAMAMQASLCYLWMSSDQGSGVARWIEGGEIRTTAWAIRTLGQYAALAPDDDVVAAEYRTLLANFIKRWAGIGPRNTAAKQLGYPAAVSTHNPKAPLTVPPWQYHFWMAANGHVWDIEPGFTPEQAAEHKLLRDWMYKGVVGMLGGSGKDNYCFTKCSAYTICVSPLVKANFSWTNPEQFFSTWGEVFKATWGAENVTCGNVLEAEIGVVGFNSTGYAANLLPAIAYAVDHGAPGALASWARLTGATNWPVLEKGFNESPVWGITPRDKGKAIMVSIALSAATQSAFKAVAALDADIKAPKPPVEGGATLNGFKWTPRRDSSGKILQVEWNGLPKNTWIEWMGTTPLLQLLPPFGAAADYTTPGVGGHEEGVMEHFEAFSGAGFDPDTGRFFHFGGGSMGANNMLSCFDPNTGKRSILIPPTHQSKRPPGYGKFGQLAWVLYPSGKMHPYFPSHETPPGDDSASACHTYAGIVFTGDQVLIARRGWSHADLVAKKWLPGAQTTEQNRIAWTHRGGIAFHGHYLKSTGLVYLTGESSQNAGLDRARWPAEVNDPVRSARNNMIVYDPKARKELRVIKINGACMQSSSCLAGDVMWYFGSEEWNTRSKMSVFAVDLKAEKYIVPLTPLTGNPPARDNGNPVAYVPELGKILMWATTGDGGMLEFDPKTLKMKPFPLAGTIPLLPGRYGGAPALPATISNKMHYWQKQKVMIIQPGAKVNARVIKLA